MHNKWLILDCNFLCHRVKHSTGGLSHDNKPTGIIYGFLKTVIALQEMFATNKVVFCWDSKINKRKDIFPDYKRKRGQRFKDLTKKEIKLEKAFRLQMKRLRREYLKEIGYRNVFCQKGYESDDLIASVCLNLPKGDEAVIITSDKDMYQCIRYNVSFYSPGKKKPITLQSFTKEYGIIPELWRNVKCYAGCSTDEVPGLPGIGEITALKYLRGELKSTTKAYEKIQKNKKSIIAKNLPLVGLPFKGTKVFKLKRDKLSEEGWLAVITKLGMKSIRDKGPFIREKRYAIKKKKSNRKFH